jgi:hypothetical protein
MFRVKATHNSETRFVRVGFTRADGSYDPSVPAFASYKTREGAETLARAQRAAFPDTSYDVEEVPTCAR